MTEIIGLSAVVISLVFVGYELRQNTKQMRAEASNTITERVNMMNAGVYNDASLASILIRGEQEILSLNEVELRRFVLYQFSRLNLAEYILDLDAQGVSDLNFDFVNVLVRDFKTQPGLQKFIQSIDSTYEGSDQLYLMLTE